MPTTVVQQNDEYLRSAGHWIVAAQKRIDSHKESGSILIESSNYTLQWHLMSFRFSTSLPHSGKMVPKICAHPTLCCAVMSTQTNHPLHLIEWIRCATHSESIHFMLHGDVRKIQFLLLQSERIRSIEHAAVEIDNLDRFSVNTAHNVLSWVVESYIGPIEVSIWA